MEAYIIVAMLESDKAYDTGTVIGTLVITDEADHNKIAAMVLEQVNPENNTVATYQVTKLSDVTLQKLALLAALKKLV